ncbi:MAG: Os1348 family NHLP clan protein [Armatimonadota bacterium]
MMPEKPDLEKLVRRTVSDPVFRRRLLANPEAALSEAGWDLPPDDVAALKQWHANLNSTTTLEELERSLAAFVASRAPR